MYYNGDKVEGVKIAYIGGGSRGWAWGFMSDLANEPSISGSVYLYDICYEAAFNNEIIGSKFNDLSDTMSKWNYKATKNISEALNGADFVVISIMPGTFKEMKSDVHTPEKYGVYQSVGDSTGPGGVMRALRCIPLFFEIAKEIERYCPNAWVINYTNPMALCVNALYKAFPKIKAFGCCHEVFTTQKMLAYSLEEILGIKDVKREEIIIDILGVNHFTWITKAQYKNIDLFSIYKKFVDKYYESGFILEKDNNWRNGPFANNNRVKFDLFKKYGKIAAAGDRHLAEFMPNHTYLKDPKTVSEWGFSLTSVDWRETELVSRLDKSQRLINSMEAVQIKETGEEGVLQIKAILGLGQLVTNVNLPNIGQIQELPLGVVVETNATFRDNSVIPVVSRGLPKEVMKMVEHNVNNQSLIMKSFLEKDSKYAYEAFKNDPLMSEVLEEDCLELFREMIENTKEYLPNWMIIKKYNRNSNLLSKLEV